MICLLRVTTKLRKTFTSCVNDQGLRIELLGVKLEEGVVCNSEGNVVDSLEREVVVLVVFVGDGVMFTFFELFFNEFFDVGIKLFMLFGLELLKFTGKHEIQFSNEGCDFAFRFRVENEVDDSS